MRRFTASLSRTTVVGNPALPDADTTSRGSQTRGRLGEGGARDRGNQADDAVSGYPHTSRQ